MKIYPVFIWYFFQGIKKIFYFNRQISFNDVTQNLQNILHHFVNLYYFLLFIFHNYTQIVWLILHGWKERGLILIFHDFYISKAIGKSSRSIRRILHILIILPLEVYIEIFVDFYFFYESFEKFNHIRFLDKSQKEHFWIMRMIKYVFKRFTIL